MRSSVAMRLSKALSILCAAVLCCSLIPTYAFASQTSLSLIPEGEQGAASIVSGAEGGEADVLALRSDEPSSVDGGGAAISSEDVNDTNEEQNWTQLREESILSTIVDLEDGSFSGEDEPNVEQALETSERGAFYANVPTYSIVFDANGGDYAPEGAAYMAAFGGKMPSIERALHRDAQGKAVPPVRDKFVFMGWYDGSDYAHAERFYTRDFTVDSTCVQTYPYPADGLRLYAGWAPIIDVDVPASVSISVGTILAMDGPSVTSDAIVNRSPWPIRCTSLSWDDTELPVTESDLLAFEVEMGAGTLDTMFSDANGASGKNGVYLTLTPVLPSAPTTEVQPGGTVALGDASALTVAAATEAVPESRLPIDYSLRLANGIEVASTEKVSKTRLVTSYEAVVAPADDTRSSIMFSANGGLGGQSKSLPGVKGAAMPELTDKSAPVYEGREFMGWYDDPVYTRGTRYYDASGEAVPGKVWDEDAACVLYAGWKTKGCTVILVAGPEGSTASMSYDAVVPSSTYEVLYDQALSSVFGDELPVPFWEPGYAFCGWWTERVGGERVYANTVMKDYTNPTVLYGRWSGFPVAVTWDACGGSGVATWEGHPAGSALGTLPETSRTGFTFAGWFTQPSGGMRIDATTVVSDSPTFYAQWTPNMIALSWDLDGTVTTSTQTYGDGATVLFPEGLASPSKGEGWLFRGWYEKNVAGDAQGMPVSTTTPLPTENMAYTAFWDVEVTFDANGGAFGNDETVSSTCQHAGGTSKLQLPQNPTREGYVFDGWYASDGTKVDAMTAVTAPVSYLARWTDGRPVVIFDANGGAFEDGTSTYSVRGLSGAAMSVPADPVRTGYVFDGWIASGGTSIPANPVFPTSNTTYTAKWVAKTTTVLFDKNGGDASTDMPLSVTATYGLPMPEIEGAPERSGYEFLGFYDKAEGGTEYYDKDLKSVRAWDKEDAQTTLYAQWRSKLNSAPTKPADSDPWGGNFYLHLTPEQAKDINENSGSSIELDEVEQYIDAESLKNAAKDISDKGDQSDYYELFNYIMLNDIQFTAYWENVRADNHGNRTAASTSYAGTSYDYPVRLIGLCQDYKTEDKKAVAGFTFQFAENSLSWTYRYNVADDNAGGWKKSQLRAAMNPSDGVNATWSEMQSGSEDKRSSIWDRAPKAITDNLQPVYKYSHNSAGDADNSIDGISATRDALFVASYSEMAGTNEFSSYLWVDKETGKDGQYQYWKAKSIDGKNTTHTLLKKNNSKSAAPTRTSWSIFSWWLRTVYPGTANDFFGCNTIGGLGASTTRHGGCGVYSVVPCWCF